MTPPDRERKAKVKAYAHPVKRKEGYTSRPMTDKDQPQVLAEREAEIKSRRLSLLELITKSSFYHLHHPWPNGKKIFSREPDMARVDRFYPYAEGGALYVDTPKLQPDIDKCDKKRPLMLKQGLRYIVVEPGKGEMEIRKQLEEVDAQILSEVK